MRIILILMIAFFNGVIFAQSPKNNEWIEIFEYLDQSLVTKGLNENYEGLACKVFDNDLGKTELRIGLEHLRIDEKSEIIINRKSEYPIPDIKNMLVNNKLISSVGINMYARLFEIPITTLNISDSLISLLDDDKKESNYTIGLIVIPIKKTNNYYTFRLSFLTAIKVCGKYFSVWFRGQNIEMEIGEKIKIEFDHKTLGQHVDINKGNNDISTKKNTELYGMYGFHYSIQSSGDYWKIFPNVNGKQIEFTSDDKFFEGKKDYLILSFESE